MKLPQTVLCATVATLLTLFLAACVSNNPDEIRKKTAEATQTMRRDAKAMAEGVKEGMTSGKTVNVNKASKDDLLSLPGISERDADRIISNRPFQDTRDLLTRHILGREEYDKIKDRIIAGH